MRLKSLFVCMKIAGKMGAVPCIWCSQGADVIQLHQSLVQEGVAVYDNELKIDHERRAF